MTSRRNIGKSVFLNYQAQSTLHPDAYRQSLQQLTKGEKR